MKKEYLKEKFEKFVWANCSVWKEPDSWGSLASYRKLLKDGRIKLLWQTK